jgi:hypothetical protein
VICEGSNGFISARPGLGVGAWLEYIKVEYGLVGELPIKTFRHGGEQASITPSTGRTFIAENNIIYCDNIFMYICKFVRSLTKKY